MRLFAVLGMHRSGTSVVSRTLNLLGGHLGPEADRMPPKPDNPTGFWESLPIAQIHDDLLAHLGGRWDQPPLLVDGWDLAPDMEPFRERLRAVVETHFAGAPLGVWKDPRGSLLLPLWRQVVPIAGTILCVRDPDEVAASLAAREGMDAEHAASLWLRYTVAAYRCDAAHLLVSFEETVQEPALLAGRLARFVGVTPDDAAVDSLGRFVDPARRHHTRVTGAARAAGPVLRLARATHALLTGSPPEVTAPLLELVHEGASGLRG